MNKITSLISKKKTVFAHTELQNLFPNLSKKAFEQFLFRAKQNGDLLNPIRGIWTLPAYDNRELACKMVKDSYISCESVLYDAGAIFQAHFHTTICIAPRSLWYTFQDHTYIYRKLKSDLLNNDFLVRTYDTYRIATAERALCDYVYLYPRAGVDAPEVFDLLNSKGRFEKLFPLYPKTTQQAVRKLLPHLSL